MEKKWLMSVVAWLMPLLAMAGGDYDLRYTVGLDTAGHYLNVQLAYESKTQRARSKEPAREVVLNMPVWTPGYYEILDFPKHLCDFSARDSRGGELAWRKEGKNRWRVALPSDGRATVSYRIYANARDVAQSRLEPGIAFVAPAGVFMHVDGDLQHPVEVTYQLPQGWQYVATGLKAEKDSPAHFIVRDFDTLYDSPLLMGNFYYKTFTHEGHGYEFALETPDGVEESGFEGDFRRIVSAATQLMGHVPYDNYSLIHMGAGGGGLEHLNSQACYTDGTFRFPSREVYVRYLAFTAHEYFHLYNVKCIRPAELWPIDYNREAFTPMLWVSEGLTCYYEFRLLLNAGIATPDEALGLLSNYFCRYAPYEGQHHMSLRQSSYDIWLNFMNEDENEHDVRINYYFKGPIIGLLLDIDIREKTGGGRSLDDVMRLLYNRYYRELQRGFTEEEFWALTEEVAGRSMKDMRRLVDTTAPIDYAQRLRAAGLYIDTADWTIHRTAQPTSAQRNMMKALKLLN